MSSISGGGSENKDSTVCPYAFAVIMLCYKQLVGISPNLQLRYS